MNTLRNFVAAIILKAVNDYKTMKVEVTEFFMSKWGQHLCDIIDMSAKTILQKLESNDFNADLLGEQES